MIALQASIALSQACSDAAGIDCPQLSALTSNSTHYVDAERGKLYVWKGTGAALPAAKQDCTVLPTVDGIQWGSGLLTTYNSFSEVSKGAKARVVMHVLSR